MKLSNLDRVAGMPGVHPLADALQWLDTLTKAPRVSWNPDQLAAARAALLAAREVMAADVLTLAAIHFPNAEPARMADKVECVRERIDAVEDETAAVIRAQEAGQDVVYLMHALGLGQGDAEHHAAQLRDLFAAERFELRA